MGAIDLAQLAAVGVAAFGANDPATVAQALETVRPAQRAAAEAWDGERPVPEELAALALTEQRLVFDLADSRRLRARVIPRLPVRERAAVRDEVRAQVALAELAGEWPVKSAGEYKTGKALPATTLWRYYGRGKQRFGVRRSTLAAINLVESSLNRLRSKSVADAKGPMQFIDATWEAYGLGGDVHDPRDAILGAANYLQANGAPGDTARALYRYNPSRLYVDAVQRLARHMGTEAGFRFYYARSLFVRGPKGTHRRLTGP